MICWQSVKALSLRQVLVYLLIVAQDWDMSDLPASCATSARLTIAAVADRFRRFVVRSSAHGLIQRQLNGVLDEGD